MSIFTKIGDLPKYFKLWSWFNNLKNAAIAQAVENGKPRPGWTTAHFWTMASASTISAVAMAGHLIPSPWGVVIPAVLTLVYAMARQFEKVNFTNPWWKCTEIYAVFFAALATLAGQLQAYISPELFTAVMTLQAAGLAAIVKLSGSVPPSPELPPTNGGLPSPPPASPAAPTSPPEG